MARSKSLRMPDFPLWLWIIFGVAIVLITAPLSVQTFQNGEFQYACTSGNRSTIPLHLRNWKIYSGNLAYISAFGWALVALSGVSLPFQRVRLFGFYIGMVGFFIAVYAYSSVCPS
jgi:hypothetical protein